MKLKWPSFPIKLHVSKLKRYANENVNRSGGRVSWDWIVSFMGPLEGEKAYISSIWLSFGRIASSVVCSKLWLFEAGCGWLYFWLCLSVVRVNGPIHRTSDCTMSLGLGSALRPSLKWRGSQIYVVEWYFHLFIASHKTWKEVVQLCLLLNDEE